MNGLWLAAPTLLLAAAAYAQTDTIRSEPLPPLQQQWQQQGAPPVLQAPPGQAAPGQAAPGQATPGQAPSGPDTANQDQQPSAAPPVAATAPATMERPSTWLPGSVVKLQALDKVNAQSAALTIKVGDSTTFGSLKITAKACVLRPTDQPADAAAFLAVTDSHPDSAGFSGWMLEDEPSASMMENPIYDLRVTGCT
jgi:hypothetical protein